MFDEFIKNYCFSRKRVGFWQTDKHGTMTFFFDVKNQEELDAVNKEFEIQRAKKLLEDECIIEKVEDELGIEELPEPDYSKGI